MNSAMIQHPLLIIMFALAVGFRPVETVQFGVAFAARARDAREVGFGLHEEVVAVATFDPAVVGGGEEGGGEVEVAWGADGAAFAVLLIIADFGFHFGGGLDAGDGLLRGRFLEVASAALACW